MVGCADGLGSLFSFLRAHLPLDFVEPCLARILARREDETAACERVEHHVHCDNWSVVRLAVVFVFLDLGEVVEQYLEQRLGSFVLILEVLTYGCHFGLLTCLTPT